jgi:thiosulfate/3-mercaptopyruvate sulfurtransferase
LPTVTESKYPLKSDADDFTVGFQTVAARLGKPGTVIIDVRPADFYTGKKSDEARAGHIPGAVNRAFSEDVIVTSNKVVTFKPIADLAAAYSQIVPSKDTEVIVHCRTGHQASQTFFVLKHLLGYTNVRWYDAGWTEWAARPELPIVQ